MKLFLNLGLPSNSRGDVVDFFQFLSLVAILFSAAELFGQF